MKTFTCLAFILLLAVGSCKQTKETMKPPIAKQVPKALTTHGHTRIDPYYWLNERDAVDVIAYLEAENAYTDHVMAPTADLQQKLFDEMMGRIQQTDMSVPVKLNGYEYYTRFEQGKEYPIYCRKAEHEGAMEEVMLDGNLMAEGKAFFQIGGWQVSNDNKLLAYSVDTVSRRQYTIYIKNLATGEVLPDAIPNTSGNMAWSNDNKTLYYSIKDETLRSYKIMKHRLGQEATSDELVYHETDPTFSVFVFKTKSRDFIVIGSESTVSSEYRFQPANDPSAAFKVVQPRRRDLLYNIDHYGDYFYIRTNHQATNFRLMRTPVGKTEISQWKDVIPHRDEVLLEDFDIFSNYLALVERKNGLNHIRVIEWKTGEDYYIQFDEPAWLAYLSANMEFDTDKLRYSYMSLVTPSTVFEHDMKTRQRTLLKQQEVLGGYNAAEYASERFFVPSHDGVLVPVSVVYKKSAFKHDGTNPLVLYGYGSYGASMDTYFSSSRISLLDRGFVWAVAHVRGGQEMGRHWYEDGKLLKKKNTFLDFIAVGEHLVKEKYTATERMFAMGGSAGGLLVGAVMNMRPELWKGVVAQVPFVDVITTMLDESIPLTTGEYDEWGNPADKVFYDYMLSYSPYDNVEAKAYPALLVTTGYHDSQVQYWEPAKWVARLRALKTDNNTLLLKTEMDYGHGGASGRFQALKEQALIYAFMLNELGMKD